MLYPEFNKYEPLVDNENPFCNAYRTKGGHIFFVEPGFYEGLLGYKEKRPERFQELLAAIDIIVKKNERVVFTWNFESPFVEKEGYIYREIIDIADSLNIYVEDKSRGSDYGD